MKKELTTRQLQAIETKSKIRTRALEMFAESDYENVKASDICKSLNLSVGSFYNYYKSKEELLLEEYPLFDNYIETKFVNMNFSSNIDAILHLIYKQCHESEIFGSHLYSQLLRVIVKTGDESVYDENRSFNHHLGLLISRAIEQHEINTTIPVDDIVTTILSISRGIMLDWSIKKDAYSVSEKSVYYVKQYLSSLK